MKKSAYKDLYVPAFLFSASGKSDIMIVAFLRAASYYYDPDHNNKSGLDDNDEYLRRLCRVEKVDWKKVKGQVFDDNKYFKLIKGKWYPRSFVRTQPKGVW